MKIGDWPVTESLNCTYREIRDLGLELNLAELEAYGFTVIEDALPREVTVEARGAVIRAAERFLKTSLDLESEETHREVKSVAFLLYQDPVFETIVQEPKCLALMNYFLGRSCVLSGLASHVKGPGGDGLRLHSDISYALPSPYPTLQSFVNCNYALTDYTEEKGALAIVPGSHRLGRPPTPVEEKLAGNGRNPDAVPMEVPAGSAVIFLGTTWHGSFPRQVPGLRINLSAFYVRPHMAPIDRYRDCVPEGLLDRHGGRDSVMARLLGFDAWAGSHEEGPDSKKHAAALAASSNWYN